MKTLEFNNRGLDTHMPYAHDNLLLVFRNLIVSRVLVFAHVAAALFLGLATNANAAPFAYVANEEGTVSVIDTATNTVTTTIAVGFGADSVAVHPDGSPVYVANRMPSGPNSTLSVINATTNAVVETVTLGSLAFQIAIHPDGSQLFVAHRIARFFPPDPLDGKIAIIDTSTNTIVNSFSLGVGSAGSQISPFNLVVHPQGDRLYVSHGHPDTFGLDAGVAVVDIATRSVIVDIPTLPPTDLVAHPSGKFIYATHPVLTHPPTTCADFVSVIDTDTNTVVDTIQVGQCPFGITIHPFGTFIYVGGNETVSVIDTSTNAVVATIPITGCCEFLGVHPEGTFVYTANSASHTVGVIDTTTNALVATVPVGLNPRDIGLVPAGVPLVVIDEDSIDNGNPPNLFSDFDVNDGIAAIGLRTPLSAFAGVNVGTVITLHTGEVGDEGWFALKTIPDTWAAASPTDDGLRNFVGNPSAPFPHNVGPGLGSGNDPEALLDKVPEVTPLRAAGLKLLEGQRVCAVVYDSDVSINYDPLNGSLKGANLGTVAFRVLDVRKLEGFSSSSLPEVDIEILDAEEVCEGDLTLFTGAPEPASSSEPFDVEP